MQLVAVEIANPARRIEQRPRPARDGGIDDAERIAAFFRIRSDYDRDVMIGQLQRQPGSGGDIQRQQLDPGWFQQKLDRRVATHVDRGCQRENAQLRLFRRTRRTKQPMKVEHLGLDRDPGRLVAEQLGDQRQIETFPGGGGAVGNFRNQLVAQRTKIGSIERHRRQPGKSDTIGANRLSHSNRLAQIRLHWPPLQERQIATRHRRETPMARRDRGGSPDRPAIASSPVLPLE